MYVYMRILYIYIYVTGMEKGLDIQVGICVGYIPYQHTCLKAI